MNISGKHYRTICFEDSEAGLQIIDQRYLPHKFIIEDINSVTDMAIAIKEMHVRGAGLIGAAAGFGMYLPVRSSSRLERELSEFQQDAAKKLKATRPTAVNLAWAVDKQLRLVGDKELTIKAKLSAIKNLLRKSPMKMPPFVKKLANMESHLLKKSVPVKMATR